MKLVMFKDMITLTLDIEFDTNSYTRTELEPVVTKIVENFGFDHGYIENEEE